MRRTASVMLLTLGIALLFSFLVPLAPVYITQSNSILCYPGQIGSCGTITTSGLHTYGSVTYRLFGVGGAWYQGHLEILQNGCYVADTPPYKGSICTKSS